MTSQTTDNPTVPYGDGRVMVLPTGWQSVEPAMFSVALAQTEYAFTAGAQTVAHAVGHLTRYYDPTGKYAGATFLEVENHDDYAVTAADLWAVSTLSMVIPVDAGRALMQPGPLRTIVNGKLRHLPATLPLSDVTAEHLNHMWDLYSAIRSMLPALGDGPTTNQWVLASKICARKRPLMFPLRDSKICAYLANNPRLGGKEGQLGRFQRDIQVLAHLITHPNVRRHIGEVREELTKQQPTWTVDWSDLRVLDIVLWMQAARP